MSFFTNPTVQALRRFLRRLGLTRPIAKMLGGQSYEARFDDAMMAAIGDARTVWDIGANAGLYTRKFANAINQDGLVIAFEPSPRSAENLRSINSSGSEIKVQQVALSDSAGEVFFEASSSGPGTTDRIVDYETETRVAVTTADNLVFEDGWKTPDFVKIDVEGFEIDVLKGMTRLLKEKPPRDIFVEIHFTALDERGFKNAPREIESLFKLHGYQVEWPDNSHIHASKTA